MKSAIENLSSTRTKISFEVPFEELQPSIDAARKEIGQQITVPGFRKGKVPARIIEQRVGLPAIMERAINNGLDEFYRSALEEHSVVPLGSPDVDVTKVPGLVATDKSDLIFTIEVDVRPEIELPSLEGRKVAVELDEDDENVDEAADKLLDELRARFATLKTVERPAKDGDFVSIDLNARIGDDQIDAVEGVSFEIGSKNMLDGLDEALEGLSAGEETTFDSTLMGGARQGETATIKVKVQSVKERELPEVDEDFVELASEFSTVDELKEDLKVQAQRTIEYQIGYKARVAFVDALVEELDPQVPAAFLEDSVKRTLEQQHQHEHTPEQDEEVREAVAKSIRTSFVLDALTAEIGEQPQPAHISQYLEAMAASSGMNSQQFIQMLMQSNRVEDFMADAAKERAITLALRKAELVDAKGAKIELPSLFEEPEGVQLADGADEASEDEGAEEAVEAAEPAKKPARKKKADVEDEGASA
ncbi:trigger factor [Micrococcales bacterium 31B]|nr:trigger factor [Micrococcales bacterium 31B]